MLKIIMTCIYQSILIYELYIKIPTGQISFFLSLACSTYSL